MKKLLFIIGLISLGLYSFTGPNESNLKHATDPNDCLVKARSGWGFYSTDCAANYKDSYTVVYANECDYALDAKICLQQEHGSWKCFTKFSLAPADSIEGHVCIGTGKRLKFTRRANDTEIKFPTDEDINNKY